MMLPQLLHDKATIEAFLRRDTYLHLYELGDLDDFFWPYTAWFATPPNAAGETEALYLLYTGAGLPVLLANAESGREALRELIAESQHLLPRRFYSHFSPGIVDQLAGSYQLEHHGHYLKMGLTDPARLAEVDTRAVERLTPDQAAEVKQFYDEAYPGNWFDARMLETGCYFAMRQDGRITSVAGIHTYSPAYRAAALGNITTHPAYYGRSLARQVTARLCQELCQQIDYIGLNVRADNAPALALYTRLGFTPVAEYDEYMLEAR